MNKIYSLKYSAVTGGLVAVSELTKKAVVKSAKNIVASATILLISGAALNIAVAAQLNTSNVWARDYLDLAQNKGIFKAGTENISLKLKNGSSLVFPELSIPDFSPASNKGATTSIGGAYSVTATHNGTAHHAIATQSWGNTNYNAVNRATNGDFAVQRLNKYVVETLGVTEYVDFNLNQQQALERYGVMYNGKKQIIGFRAGAGSTYIKQNGSNYFTGEGYNSSLLSASLFRLEWNNKRVFNDLTAFHNHTSGGDSGSGYYLYDKNKNKWVLMGTHYGVGGNWSIFNQYRPWTVEQFKKSYISTLALNGQNLGSGKLAYNNRDNVLTGGGTLTFYSDVNLGNGGLIFDAGHNYKVITHSNRTFKGAGVDVGKGSTVEWSVKNAARDTLHKIGEGTLDVKVAQNTNLKTGNGTVVLSTAKAFNNIYMASGHGTVKLNADNALGNGDYSGIFFTENGGTLDLNGHDQTFKYIAATDSGTTITNTNKEKAATLSVNNTDAYIYHGNVTGNTKITHSFDQKQQNGRLILDGDVNTSNDISIKNAQLVMQGHATDHAVFRDGFFSCNLPAFLCPQDYVKQIQSMESAVNKKNGTTYKSNNQVSDFSQPDWEGRTFNFGTLHLENADFAVARNADVKGNVDANNSTVTLGTDKAYIDLHAGKNITNDGFSFRKDVKEGTSSATGNTSFEGDIKLANASKLTVNNTFKGGINSDSSSTVMINSGADVTLNKNSAIASSLKTDAKINISDVSLTLSGIQKTPSVYDVKFTELTGNNSGLTIAPNAQFTGDIKMTGTGALKFGEVDDTQLTVDTTKDPILGGFASAYNGNVYAPSSLMSANNALFNFNGESYFGTGNVKNSVIHFSPVTGKDFGKVQFGQLEINNSALVLRANNSAADSLQINNKLTGSNNKLLVDFIDNTSAKENGLNIPLVTAPAGTSKDVFKADTQKVGFSDITPVVETKDVDGKSTWTLTGYKTVANADATQKARSLMSGDYKAFLAEVNNLNKRMGDLRDINGEAGAWARIMSGTGSAGGGFSDNYTHVQVGADKKHELDGLDLFTGVTMTYTDSHAGSDAFSGETTSVGAGIYASALFESGAYIDLIGKYVHHDNEYTATFAGLGTKDYSSHSWYAGAEVGYRYHVTEDAWIEPQAELVYGAVSGKQFSWKDQGMNLTMKDKDFNPLIGRTGVDVGKSFSGKDWKVTARAGLGYQFDLLANGETVLRDASGEKRIKGEKDGRMLMSVGLNAEVRNNIRFGLEFEKSAFGKYNVDNAVNANFRYSF
ncbi:autotransporter outer membrane beta-barrel domain-containing protein [Escherichia coli]|nr:autotransporter outer membrane beta-barrel domain-containing protein [Escherichia coli]